MGVMESLWPGRSDDETVGEPPFETIDDPEGVARRFDLLANPRRIRIIEHVLDRGTITFEELVSQIAAAEHGVSMVELTEKQRKRVWVSLHQSHLPKLDDYGVVSYDPDNNDGVRTVAPGSAFHEIASLLADAEA